MKQIGSDAEKRLARNSREALRVLSQGILLALLAPLFTVAVLEILLRGWAYFGGKLRSGDVVHAQADQSILRRQEPALAQPHPDRIFDLRAGGHQVFEGREFTINMLINSRRLRDREHRLAKPVGTYRILALGDSFTFGWGVNVKDTWWAELERLITHRLAPRPVEVINLGVYDYTFDQQVQRLEEYGFDYHPDIIVADFYYPHVVTISTHTYEAQSLRPWPRIHDSTIYVDDEGLLRFGRPLPFERLRQRSLLADLVLSRYKKIKYGFGAVGQLNEFELLRADRQQAFQQAWHLTHEAYERLVRLAASREIPVVVFSIPRDMQVWPAWKEDREEVSRRAPFGSRLPQERFAKFCRDLNMMCLDLIPRFVGEALLRPLDPLYYPVDVHWTPLGHKLAGRIVFEYLVEHRVVK